MKALLKLNHNIDREPLKKGQRDDSKLTITIKHPGGKADVLYNYSKKENGTVDFNSAKVVREVNKWRNQIFRSAITGGYFSTNVNDNLGGTSESCVQQGSNSPTLKNNGL